MLYDTHGKEGFWSERARSGGESVRGRKGNFGKVDERQGIRKFEQFGTLINISLT